MEATVQDATADFYSALSDPTRWIIKAGVPIFKQHERTDPATGQQIKVDLPKLYRIAGNILKLERQGGVPIRMTLGHTEPGKPETHQPPVGGYYRNARVQPFGPAGEPALVVDEWLDPQYAKERKNFPYRSAEYYDDSEQITGVALLTRDPYLDLGVVAYTKAGPGAVHYSRTVERRPLLYHFLTGEATMYPPGAQPNPHGLYTGPVIAPPGPMQQPIDAPIQQPQVRPIGHTADGTPIFAGHNQVVQPTAYSGQSTVYSPTPTPYGGSWDQGNAHTRHNIGHDHPSGGAIYAGYYGPQPRQSSQRPRQSAQQGPGRYATELPDDAPPGDSGLGEPGGQDDLMVVHDCLTQAVEALSRMIGSGGPPPGPPGEPPQSPFPDEMAGRYGQYSPPRRNQRYSAGSSRPPATQNRRNSPAPGNAPAVSRNPADPRSRSNYNKPGEPMRTISGLPVGYQMRMDQLQYQNRQLKEAMDILYYERDQNDTEWCISEIRRLAQAGYDVGDVEFYELKNRPREQRVAYLDHIATKYQRIGTDMLPPIMGDPTPGADANQQRGPMTREEMDAALKMTSGNPDPAAFSKAVAYIRANGATAAHGPAFGGLPQPGIPVNQNTGAWNDGAPAPAEGYDPYPEPSVNGY